MPGLASALLSLLASSASVIWALLAEFLLLLPGWLLSKPGRSNHLQRNICPYWAPQTPSICSLAITDRDLQICHDGAISVCRNSVPFNSCKRMELQDHVCLFLTIPGVLVFIVLENSLKYSLLWFHILLCIVNSYHKFRSWLKCISLYLVCSGTVLADLHGNLYM